MRAPSPIRARSPATAAPPDGAAGWRVTLAVTACLAAGPSTLLVACFGVMVHPLSLAYGWSRSQIGSGISFMAAAIMLAAVLQGVLLDRFGARRVVLCSIPLFAAGLATLATLPPRLPLFYLAWFVLPFAAAGLWPGSYLKAVSGWFDRRLGIATGVANAGIGLGTIVVPPIVAWSAARWAPRGGFLALAAIALLAWPVAALLVRENPSADPAGTRPARARLGALLGDRRYRCVIASFLLIGLPGTGLLASITPILMSHGLSERAALSGLAGYGAMSLAGRIASGLLLDRMHATRVYQLLAACTVAGLLVLLTPAPAWLLLAGVAALGLISGGEFDVLGYALRRYFGLATFGRRYGLAYSGFQLGAAIGAALLAASIGTTGAYQAGLALLVLATIASAALFSRLGPYPEPA